MTNIKILIFNTFKEDDTLNHLKQKQAILIGLMIFIFIFSISMQHRIANSTALPTVKSTKIANPKITKKQIYKQQSSIRKRLQKYLDQETKNNSTSIAFFNLSPIKGSRAAHAKYAKVYRSGALAAQSRGHSPMIAASTYKLFISAFLFSQEKSGNFSWNMQTLEGFNRMIVYSENDFADDELMNFGMDNVNTFIAGHNWYAPVFVQNKDAVTTADSLLNLLYHLETRQDPFNNPSERNLLLSKMKRQVYRSGIPAGASQQLRGAVVADKVGFLNGVNNDAAIVTLPNGQRYLLVIMTDSPHQTGFSGFPRIAHITQNIQAIVYK